MKRFAAIVIWGMLALGPRALAVVNWESDYDIALEKAKKEKKLVMVDLYTDWCGWCRKLDRDTYANKDVEARLTNDFVALKINPEKSLKNATLARRFGTRGFPHIVFLDTEGKKVSEIGGYLPSAAFLERLAQITEQAKKK